jgi:hypothetical protein
MDPLSTLSGTKKVKSVDLIYAVKIYAVVTSPDAKTRSLDTEMPVLTTSGALVPASATQPFGAVQNDTVGATDFLYIRYPYVTDNVRIDVQCEVICRGRRFNIIGIENLQNDNRYLRLSLIEIGDMQFKRAPAGTSMSTHIRPFDRG